MTVRHPRKLKLFFLSLSPNNWGERVRVRGHLTKIFLYHPSLPLFPLRDPVILISLLKSGSVIPSAPTYVKRCGTLSSPSKGRRI
jgi:hypothetical protein